MADPKLEPIALVAWLLRSDEPVDSFKEALLPSAQKAINVYNLLTKKPRLTADIHSQYQAKYGKLSLCYVQIILNELKEAGAPIVKSFKPSTVTHGGDLHYWSLK